jgi:nitrogen fixation protein NifQ
MLAHTDRASHVAALLARPAAMHASADPLRPILASLLVGRSLGEGVLPATLGLLPTEFQRLADDYFSGMDIALADGCNQAIEELADLFTLLREYRAGRQESEVWLARIVAWGCAGRDHLWQDLGLVDRGELSTLMTAAFPGLAALNVTDMKWKKFIYRHYCSREGIYVCPAPSCSECADFAKCHGPER